MQKSVMELSSWPFSVIWMLSHQVKKQIGKHRRLWQLKKDGYLFGRGVQDDKGPSMAALYAVKALLK